jgi:tRNA A-37 threonylcarbamoyl transferase component Bud32
MQYQVRRNMHDVKDTARALVRIGFDGRVHKTFRGHLAKERFENEVRVLRFLEEKGCDFVPRVIEAYPEQLKLVTTNCGQRIDHLNPERMSELYDSLLPFGVRHQDAVLRNITYDRKLGRFCIIDFEFAMLLHAPELSPPPPPPDAPRPPGSL